MKIVINRTDAIGDTLLTLPMARMIKEHHPEAYVIFWVSQKSRDLFEYYKWVDEIWIMDRSKYWPKRMIHAFKKIFATPIDAYFFVAGSHFPSLFAWLKRIKFRGGLRSKWQSFVFLNHSIRQKRSLVEMHESDYNLLLLDEFNIKYDIEDRDKYRPLLTIPEEQVQKAKDKLGQYCSSMKIDWRDRFIVIHPGMVGHTLNWPMISYVELIAKMESRWPTLFTYIISYTQSDMPYIQEIKKNLSDEQYQLLNQKILFYDGGHFGLKEYLKVIKSASLFIGPSTGTTHLANCLDIPQIGFYSPIKVQSAMRWGPYLRSDQKCRVLIPDVVCGEQFHCAMENCYYYECMSKIEVDDVVKHAGELLKIHQSVVD